MGTRKKEDKRTYLLSSFLYCQVNRPPNNFLHLLFLSLIAMLLRISEEIKKSICRTGRNWEEIGTVLFSCTFWSMMVE